jgi:hypothetical protein
MLAWRLYYGDGSTFDASCGLPSAAPPMNLQAIAQVADIDIGRRTVSGYDYYWFEDGQWFGGDLFGLFDYLQRSGAVKFGRMIRREDYRAALARAVHDPDLQAKVAWDPREPTP